MIPLKQRPLLKSFTSKFKTLFALPRVANSYTLLPSYNSNHSYNDEIYLITFYLLSILILSVVEFFKPQKGLKILAVSDGSSLEQYSEHGYELIVTYKRIESLIRLFQIA